MHPQWMLTSFSPPPLDTTKVWYSDGLQTKHLWFEVKKDVVDLKVYSKFSQQGTFYLMSLAYSGNPNLDMPDSIPSV